MARLVRPGNINVNVLTMTDRVRGGTCSKTLVRVLLDYAF